MRILCFISHQKKPAANAAEIHLLKGRYLMKGLILKDLFVLQRQTKFYLLIVALLVVVSLFNPSMQVFVGMYFVLFGMMLPITAMAYDERAGWDKYALTMPVTRKKLVVGKYLLGVLLLAAAVMITALLKGIYGAVAGYNAADFPQAFMMISLSMLLGSVFLSVLLPVMFKVGTEKGRIVMILMILIPVGAVILLQKTKILSIDEETIESVVNSVYAWNPALLCLAVIAVCALLLVISAAISCLIAKRKEY